MLREVVKYRENLGLSSWPCFLAGGKSHFPLFIFEPPTSQFLTQISTFTLENPDMPSWLETH